MNNFRNLAEGAEKITFLGTPGFCTPFAELLSFVVRDRKLAFITSLDFEKARSILNPYTLWGHAAWRAHRCKCWRDLPTRWTCNAENWINSEKAKEIARKVLENSEKKRIIGLCFQSMFMQQKWDKIINFDYIINADLAVEVLDI